MGRSLSRAEVARRTEQKAITAALSQVSLLLKQSANPRGNHTEQPPDPGYRGLRNLVAFSQAESVVQLLRCSLTALLFLTGELFSLSDVPINIMSVKKKAT